MAKKDKKSDKKAKRGKMGFKARLYVIAGLLLAIGVLPSTFVISVGMMPTIVAYFLDKTKKGTLALTIGAMNLAGCMPFLIEVWMLGHEFDDALNLISDPFTIIIMYSAAGIGYLINWSMSGVVEAIMVKNSDSRLIEIQKQQDALVEKWGVEVTGAVVVDEHGFAVVDHEE